MDDRRAEYDPAKLLTRAALIFVFVLIVFVATIIGVQIWKSGEANTESWAALTGIIGWVTGVVGTIYSNRFGTTQQAEKKDKVIEQQSRAAAGAATNGAPVVTPAPATANGIIPAAEVAAPTNGDIR